MLTKQPKPRKCPVCLEMYTPKRYGLRLTRCCENAGCRLDYAQGVRAKEAQKEARQQKKAFLDNDKSFQRAKAQKAFNEFIRLRDKNYGSISCDKPYDWTGQWHAGHYKTVGSRPDLRFDENNCHKQCSACNNYLSGNLANYTIKLAYKLGSSVLSELERVGEPKKYTAQDYKAIYEHYKAKIKQLKAEQS